MYLMRLIYLNPFKQRMDIENDKTKLSVEKDLNYTTKNDAIDQIKNITQTDELKFEKKQDTFNHKIKSINDLIDLCNEKKEMSLKYELETNVKLVSFENKLIEISFNDNLNKNFIKDLTSKLFEWTSERWIITLTKELGSPPIKQKIKNEKEKIHSSFKKTDEYKKLKKMIDDIELIDITEQ